MIAQNDAVPSVCVGGFRPNIHQKSTPIVPRPKRAFVFSFIKTNKKRKDSAANSNKNMKVDNLMIGRRNSIWLIQSLERQRTEKGNSINHRVMFSLLQ